MGGEYTVKFVQLIPSALVLSVGSISGAAFAQASPANADSEPAAASPAAPPVPASPPPAQGRVVVSAPPVPAAAPRAGYHVHVGFYLRMAAGVGGGHGSVSDFSVDGLGLALNLWIGGTPGPGIAVGG